MSLKQLECPNCGDTIRINQHSHIHNKEVECPSCHSIFIYQAKHSDIGAKSEAYREDASTTIYVERERAKLKNEEKWTKHKIELNEMKNYIIFNIVLLSFIGLIGIGNLVYEHFSGISTINMTESSKSLKGENYELVLDQLIDMGFENIEVEKLQDLKIGWLTKDGEVEKVMIDGENNFKKDDSFKSNSKVKIYYHTFEEKE